MVKVKEKIAKDTTKTEASYRTYPLPDYIGNMLLEMRDQREKNKYAKVKESKKQDIADKMGRMFSQAI